MLSYILALVFSMILGVLSIVYPFFKYLMEPINLISKSKHNHKGHNVPKDYENAALGSKFQGVPL